jgi:putative redox protein
MKQIATAHVVSDGANYRHAVTTGRHQLLADEPAAAGGGDTGPTPYDLLLASLGACTAITLRMYAERKGWDLGQLKVELQLLKNREGDTRIDRQLSADGRVEAVQWIRLLEIAEKTPVTLTLKAGVQIETRRA